MAELIPFVLVTGLGATICLDLWVLLLSSVSPVRRTDWGLVGRWLSGVPRGRGVLDANRQVVPEAAERVLGWSFHFAVGLAYGAALVLFWGPAYAAHPTLGPALLIGFCGATFAGLCIMMPGMGAGLAGARLPNRGFAVSVMLMNHAVFALALYGLALVMA